MKPLAGTPARLTLNLISLNLTKGHLTHIALSKSMTYIVHQYMSLSSDTTAINSLYLLQGY